MVKDSKRKRGRVFDSGRRAQVTIFILIGLVLVLAVSTVVYVSQKSMMFKSSRFLPGDVKPAAEYVEQCIESLGKEAVSKAGLQGGYVELPEYIENNPATNIRYAGIKVPYWYYEGRDTSPSLEEMQGQISMYIDENLASCVNNMTPFADQFNIEIMNEPNTETIIGKEDVIFETDYHIVMRDKSGNTEMDIEQFRTNIPVALKKVYDFAQRILERENKELFLEQATVDMMSINPDIPFTGLDFECIGGPMQWKVSDVNNEIKDAIRKDIPRIRVKNSDYVPFDEPEENYEELAEYDVDDVAAGDIPEHTPEDAYDYFHYFWDIRYDKTDLKVGFNYLPEFGSMLRVRPSTNGIMKSNVAKGTKYLSFMCFHLYHFSYDLNYPVEVIVRDDDSYNGDGYVFRFAMPVMIDHNLPNRKKTTQSLFDYRQADYDYSEVCKDLEGSYDVVVRGYDEYLYESELDDVALFYDCLKYSCYLGNTTFETGTDYRLETGLPAGCPHGFLEATKEGYLDTTKQVLSPEREEGVIEFWMPKLKTFNFSTVKKKYLSANESFGPEQQLDGNETATIHLTLDDYDFEQIEILDQDNKIDLLVEPAKTYQLEITLLDEEEELIGGYTGNWTVSYNDMKDKEELIFRVFEYWPRAESDDELMDMYTFMFDGDYQEDIEPRFE